MASQVNSLIHVSSGKDGIVRAHVKMPSIGTTGTQGGGRRGARQAGVCVESVCPNKP